MEDIIAPVYNTMLALFFLSTAYTPQVERDKTSAGVGKSRGSPLQIAVGIGMVLVGFYRWPFGGTIQVPISEIAASMLHFGAGMVMVVAAVLMLMKRLSLHSKTDLTPPSHPSRTPPAP